MCVRFLPVLWLATLLAGQEPVRVNEDPAPTITVESNLVVVPFHVHKRKAHVGGLQAEAFEVLEDGVPQGIAFLETPPGPDEAQVESRMVATEIIFLIDMSASVMSWDLLDEEIVRDGMLDAIRAGSSISLYGFGSTIQQFTASTRDIAELERGIDRLSRFPERETRLYEGIMYSAIHASKQGGSKSRKMVVFSDGFDSTSFKSALAVTIANASGIPIYPAVLTSIARSGSGFLSQGEFADLGRRTGGKAYFPGVLTGLEIRRILSAVAELIQTEYVVGYYPRGIDEESTEHRVEVRLKDPRVGKLTGGRRTVIH